MVLGAGPPADVTERAFYLGLMVSWAVAGAAAFVALFFITAPYGRHAGSRRGLPARIGWILMELPAVLVFALAFLPGERAGEPRAQTLLGLWLLHYLYRALLYPLLLSPRASPLPLPILASGIAFNLVNGYLQGRHTGHFAPPPPPQWYATPTFLVGVLLFGLGFVTHVHSDAVLRRLRRAGGYRVPEHGLHRFVASPNYFGEIVQWFGWALLSWSWPALLFALWTVANLAPRARNHLRWYRQRFPAYPSHRRALVPGLF